MIDFVPPAQHASANPAQGSGLKPADEVINLSEMKVTEVREERSLLKRLKQAIANAPETTDEKLKDAFSRSGFVPDKDALLHAELVLRKEIFSTGLWKLDLTSSMSLESKGVEFGTDVVLARSLEDTILGRTYSAYVFAGIPAQRLKEYINKDFKTSTGVGLTRILSGKDFSQALFGSENIRVGPNGLGARLETDFNYVGIELSTIGLTTKNFIFTFVVDFRTKLKDYEDKDFSSRKGELDITPGVKARLTPSAKSSVRGWGRSLFKSWRD